MEGDTGKNIPRQVEAVLKLAIESDPFPGIKNISGKTNG